MDATERFWAKVDLNGPGGCWLWTAGTCPEGYGKFSLNGRSVYAHRTAYEWLVGAIPEGLHIDHLCRVRSCVNTAHLEPVTVGENIRRGQTGSNMAAKTHCPQGHEYAGANLIVERRGKRACRECRRVRRSSMKEHSPTDGRA